MNDCCYNGIIFDVLNLVKAYEIQKLQMFDLPT